MKSIILGIKQEEKALQLVHTLQEDKHGVRDSWTETDQSSKAMSVLVTWSNISTATRTADLNE